ncbi:CDP-diacylglycerol--glycerol-3-phosphate 3-phosphatidyltransferase 2-like isoform X2 [Salvia hispanica]|uniref:CDP-diacylglycerol--glycerol-3-phosphate 3-phosphatidyltransferase 2-like isoform X2 n=1 Tax=Salvia hispanica TaxID=49212 RepID=UPI00200923AF|nr:CDP-diacylglycerol--glycerol-3-phosphate 3-phosphatidyltransferase 2-like isoform X2 [Salvia hispanica]
MPGALKFTNSVILRPHQPYTFLSPSSATTTGQSTAAIRPNQSAGWWRRTIAFSHPTRRGIASRSGRERLRLSSDSRNGEVGGNLSFNSDTNFNSKMCATANGKAGSQSDVAQKLTGKPAAKLLTLPTILTIGRVAAVPLLVGTFYVESWWGPAVTTGIFIAAAFTDWLDGYLARKMDLGTPFGAFLDPVADKLMVAATLILLCTRPFEAGGLGHAPWLLTIPAIAIIGREITMSAVREWAAAQDKKLLQAVAVNNLGKWKTASQMIALTILLAARDGSMACLMVIGCVHE